MEKQIALGQTGQTYGRLAAIIKKAAHIAGAPLRLLGRYYSLVLERDVDMRQTKTITEAQLAFFATVMPADMHILLHVAACAWFIFALKKCRSVMKE